MTRQIKLSNSQKKVIKFIRVFNEPFLFKALVKPGLLTREELKELLLDGLLVRDMGGIGYEAPYILTKFGRTINID